MCSDIHNRKNTSLRLLLRILFKSNENYCFASLHLTVAYEQFAGTFANVCDVHVVIICLDPFSDFFSKAKTVLHIQC